MNLKKFTSVAAVAAIAVSALSISASAEDYNAYLGIQSASFTFRNAWNEGSYGKGIAAEDGSYYFDHLTGWDGPTATNNGGTFTDAVITGDGTYSVSLTGDFDFGADETLNLLFVSTDIPLESGATISDVKVKIDGSTKYTFDEAYLNPDDLEYVSPMMINIWNDDLGKADGLFGYTMPTSSVEIEFTVSGLGDGAAAPVEETVEEAPAADTTSTPAATGNTSAAAVAAVMAVAGAAALVSKRK
ncbi:MAG: hypothetical protein ACI4Q6_09170 [Huintestinicola sp.]